MEQQTNISIEEFRSVSKCGRIGNRRQQIRLAVSGACFRLEFDTSEDAAHAVIGLIAARRNENASETVLIKKSGKVVYVGPNT